MVCVCGLGAFSKRPSGSIFPVFVSDDMHAGLRRSTFSRSSCRWRRVLGTTPSSEFRGCCSRTQTSCSTSPCWSNRSRSWRSKPTAASPPVSPPTSQSVSASPPLIHAAVQMLQEAVDCLSWQPSQRLQQHSLGCVRLCTSDQIPSLPHTLCNLICAARISALLSRICVLHAMGYFYLFIYLFWVDYICEQTGGWGMFSILSGSCSRRLCSQTLQGGKHSSWKCKSTLTALSISSPRVWLNRYGDSGGWLAVLRRWKCVGIIAAAKQ